LIKTVLWGLRKWDYRNSKHVTHFVGISNYIKERIYSCYGRDADVIYPPVDTEYYHLPAEANDGDYYLVVSALVPYKRVDLAVEACTRLNKKLIVIGKGPEIDRLKNAAGPEISFLGWADNEVIRHHYQHCKALIFPGEEDFGIVPVEVQACGRPVIAYAKGGALETVRNTETGLFFSDQTVESLEEVLKCFENTKWDAHKIRSNAERFSEDRFKNEIQAYVQKIMKR
ncbi:MAG: glycosyltransferase, partial [Candidatus Omnitrophica bacterium]|nr:glycosyltransferase [Candidatus Omnitrophota bacterium]